MSLLCRTFLQFMWFPPHLYSLCRGCFFCICESVSRKHVQKFFPNFINSQNTWMFCGIYFINVSLHNYCMLDSICWLTIYFNPVLLLKLKDISVPILRRKVSINFEVSVFFFCFKVKTEIVWSALFTKSCRKLWKLLENSKNF